MWRIRVRALSFWGMTGAVVEHECTGRVVVSCWFSVLSAYTERAGWDGVTGVIRARGCNSCGVERDSLTLFGLGGPQFLVVGFFRVTGVAVVICFHFATAM